MFQNTFQNGNFFELYDPKGTIIAIQHLKIKLNSFTNNPMFMEIIKYLIRNLKVFSILFSICALVCNPYLQDMFP